jgi:hypothetical protein
MQSHLIAILHYQTKKSEKKGLTCKQNCCFVLPPYYAHMALEAQKCPWLNNEKIGH